MISSAIIKGEQHSASAWSPGTCGELVEGTIGDKPFLITCPIDLGSLIEVTVNTERPAELTKASAALDLAVQRWCLPLSPLGFTRSGILPAGKGMGSSTADIAAVLTAAGRIHNRAVSGAEIAVIALEIEPTDGIMFEGITLFDHINGEIKEYLGNPMPLNILVIDPGGSVDTVKFNSNRKLIRLNRDKEPVVQQAARLIKEGLKEKDPEKLGRGAMLSAEANQDILPKPHLEQVIKWSKELGAVGVNIAHSGTVMGLLLPPDTYSPEEAREYIKSKMPHWEFYCTRLIGGGVK